MEHGSRTRLATATVLVVVFGAGLLLGLAVDGSLVATPSEVTAAGEAEGADERQRRTPMYEQVGPTEEQMVLIDSILVVRKARMDELHKEFRSAYNPRYQALIEDTREAIKGVFTPEQAVEYQALLDDFDRRKAERREKDDRD